MKCVSIIKISFESFFNVWYIKIFKQIFVLIFLLIYENEICFDLKKKKSFGSFSQRIVNQNMFYYSKKLILLAKIYKKSRTI